MMKNKIFSILVLISVLFACNETIEKQEHNYINNIIKLEKKSLEKNTCTRLIINYHENYFPSSSQTINYKPFSSEIIYETTEELNIEKFNTILKSGKKTGYCCCPEKHYTISFYEGTYNYKDFFVDTIAFDNKVRIFQSSYQFSYLIDNNSWNEYLSELETISCKEYRVHDKALKKKFYNYCQSNDIPIITSNTSSKYWMSFDGNFKCKYSSVGEYLKKEKLINNKNS